MWTKIRILDEIRDFGRTKNDILDDIFVVSLLTMYYVVHALLG